MFNGTNGLDVVANAVFCQSQGCSYFYKPYIRLCGHILQKKLASVCSLTMKVKLFLIHFINNGQSLKFVPQVFD